MRACHYQGEDEGKGKDMLSFLCCHQGEGDGDGEDTLLLSSRGRERHG